MTSNSKKATKIQIDFVWSSQKEYSSIFPLYSIMKSAGWKTNIYKIYKHRFRNKNTLKKLSSRIIISFDLPLTRLRNCGWVGKFIYIDHGLSPVKYYAYKYKFFLDAELLFFPGEVFKRKMEKLHPHFNNGVLGGLPKMDTLINLEFNRKEECDKLGLEPNNPIILFAPTWGGKYNKNWGFHNVKFLEDMKNLILLPHPADYQSARKYDAVIPKEGNIAPLLKISDVVVSDVSSILVEAALINKPVVQVELPNYPGCFPEKDKRKNGIALSEKIIEWEINNTDRQKRPFKIAYLDEDWVLGHTAKPENLKETVMNAINNPNKYLDKRQYWANQCCWKCDGKSSERIMQKIVEYLINQISEKSNIIVNQKNKYH